MPLTAELRRLAEPASEPRKNLDPSLRLSTEALTIFEACCCRDLTLFSSSLDFCLRLRCRIPRWEAPCLVAVLETFLAFLAGLGFCFL